MQHVTVKCDYTLSHFSGSKSDLASPNATEAAIQDILANQAIWNKFKLPSTRFWGRIENITRWRPVEPTFSENVGKLGVFADFPSLYAFSDHPSAQTDL